MSKGRKRKKKKKIIAQPLSFVDKIAYTVIIILVIGFAFLPFVIFEFLQKNIVLSSADVIAYESTSTVLWLLLPLFSYIIITFALFSNAYLNRTPIFGKKLNTQKRKKWWMPKRPVLCVTAFILILLLLWIPSIGGLYSRTQITEKEVRKYASFGRMVEQVSLSDVKSVNVHIYWQKHGRYGVTGSWRMSYKINFNSGESYTFSSVTDTMIKIDNLFPNIEKTVEGAKNLDDYCKDNHCTASQYEAIEKILNT